MSIHEARCVYKGDVFFGTFEVTRVGSHETIEVRYNGDNVQAETVGLRAEIVAPTLLLELVMRRAIASMSKPASIMSQMTDVRARTVRH